MTIKEREREEKKENEKGKEEKENEKERRRRTNKRRKCGWIRRKRKEEKKERRGIKKEGRNEQEREREKKRVPLLSKIYENRTIGFRRSKRQSRSMHRELRVGTKILEFHQTPRGREFSYLDYF